VDDEKIVNNKNRTAKTELHNTSNKRCITYIYIYSRLPAIYEFLQSDDLLHNLLQKHEYYWDIFFEHYYHNEILLSLKKLIRSLN